MVQTSKFLALVLRHKPEAFGVMLDAAGWTDVETLLRRVGEAGHPITREELEHVVETNNKKRFAFDESGTLIRASQGHSVPVELGYPPAVPPTHLYHGTSEEKLQIILQRGLDKRQRHHVHLYADPAAARRVGRRHGTPVVLVVDAGAMHEAGTEFFMSANGVWLTEYVEPRFISVYDPV